MEFKARRSNFVKKFTKTPKGIVCPHFYILAWANGCPYKCHFCFLKLTLRNIPKPVIYTNFSRMAEDIKDWMKKTREPSLLNTGELADSLAWDHKIGLSTFLLPLFRHQDRHTLLFLTKSTNINNFHNDEPTDRVVISFSVNAYNVSRLYEQGTPESADRLSAAMKIKNHGWRIRLRIDPIIPIQGWKTHYLELVRVVNKINPEVVTLGSLRFFPHLPGFCDTTDVFSYGIDNHDPDGRMRLPFSKRLEIYTWFFDNLNVSKVGLCKETAELHRELKITNHYCNCLP